MKYPFKSVIMKYRIMSALKFDDTISLDDLFAKAGQSDKKLFEKCYDSLGAKGYLELHETDVASLKMLSSFEQFKSDLLHTFFEIAVSCSTIAMAVGTLIMAITSILSLQ